MLELEAFGRKIRFEGEVLEIMEGENAIGYVMDTYCKDRAEEEIRQMVYNCSQIAIEVREQKSRELLKNKQVL